MRSSRTLFTAVLLLCIATAAHAQFAVGVSTSNGSDNNPNQTTGGKGDVIGSNGIYLQDTLHWGAGAFVPSYTFMLNSFAKTPNDNYVTHLFELDWIHATLFMPARVRTIIAEQAARDSIDDADTSDDETTDSVKDALVTELERIADAVESGGYDSAPAAQPQPDTATAARDTSLRSAGTPSDTTDTTDSEDDVADSTAAPDSIATAKVPAASVATAADSTRSDSAVVDPIEALQGFIANQFTDLADSLDNADGSDALKIRVEQRARAIAHALVDSFPGDSTALVIRDSVERFIVHLRRYVPPVVAADTAAESPESEDDTTIYAPLSLPRSPIYDWTQSDLSLETSDDDTARYALDLAAQYELRIERATGDSLGAHDASLTATAHQAFTGAFNLLERIQLTNTNYHVYDTLNNTTVFGTVQGRWQPSPRFTVLAEVGVGLKDYSEQQSDTQTVLTKQFPQQGQRVVVTSPTSSSQILAGVGAFWRCFRTTTIGAQGFYLNNPANNARVSANTYLVRRHGAFDLNDDRFTYTGTDVHAYLKQQLFGDIELGLTYEHASRTYNQLAFKDVQLKKRLVTIDAQIRTKDMRADTYQNGELQLTRTFYFDHFVFSQLTLEFLFGYIENKSNDPNFKFHEGYGTMNLSVDL